MRFFLCCLTEIAAVSLSHVLLSVSVCLYLRPRFVDFAVLVIVSVCVCVCVCACVCVCVCVCVCEREREREREIKIKKTHDCVERMKTEMARERTVESLVR